MIADALPPATAAELQQIDTRIEQWLAEQVDQNPCVESVGGAPLDDPSFFRREGNVFCLVSLATANLACRDLFDAKPRRELGADL